MHTIQMRINFQSYPLVHEPSMVKIRHNNTQKGRGIGNVEIKMKENVARNTHIT